MLNNATLSAVGDYLSIGNGKNQIADYVGESPMIIGRDDGVDVTVSGTYAGARLQLIGRKPDRTETTIGSPLAPADNATQTFTLNFSPGKYGDLKVKLLSITSGSIAVSANSTKSGRV